MALLLKNAHVVDPSVELDGVVDVLIDGDKIAEVWMVLLTFQVFIQRTK